MTSFVATVRALPSDADARSVAWRRVRQDVRAAHAALKWLYYRNRGWYFACLWVHAAACVAVWVMAGGPWAAPLPLVGLYVATVPLRWRFAAVWKRQCLGADVYKAEMRYGSVHTADHRGLLRKSSGAKRQLVPSYEVKHTPRVSKVKRNVVDGRLVGWTARVEAAPGQTMSLLEKRSDRLAGGQWHRVSVEVDHDDGAVGTLTVIRRDPLRGKGVPHPSLRKATDAWDDWVLGVNENGGEVAVPLAYQALLSTGLPDSGKSVLLTNAALHAALDPSVPLFIYDPAGDLAPLELCVDASGTGMYRTGGDPQGALDVMHAVAREVDRRHDLLNQGGLDAFRRKISRGELPVVAWVMEEWQTVRNRCGKAQMLAFDTLHMRIMLQHRKVAVVPLAATQDPRHDEVPVGVRNEYGVRAAHRAADDMASDVALGHGKAEQGWSAATIGMDQPGVCLLSVGGETPIKMRSYHPTDRELVNAARFAADLRRKYRGEHPPSSVPEDGLGCSGVHGSVSGVSSGGQGGGAGGVVSVVRGDGSSVVRLVGSGSNGSGGSGGSDGSGPRAGGSGGRRGGGRASRLRRGLGGHRSRNGDGN